jgi:Txe/YoeB family toxin of Txe-Axe toxin-antitoxin module
VKICAEACATEEPDAGKRHVRVGTWCARQRAFLPRDALKVPWLIKSNKLSKLIMWRIQEHRNLDKVIAILPLQVVKKKYELWKDIVFRHGPDKLREFPGFHDEKFVNELSGQRSSRLNIQYRVIYSIEKETITVYAIDITPLKYKELKK